MPDPPPAGGTPTDPEAPPPEGIAPAALLAAFSRSLASFLAAKIRLFEREISRDLSGLGGALLALAGLGVLLAMALIFAGAGAALLVGEALGSPGGGFLLVAGAFLAGALITWAAARKRLMRLRHVLRETRADLRRDAEWLKNLP